jgi:hypothetical protein
LREGTSADLAAFGKVTKDVGNTSEIGMRSGGDFS